MLKPKISVARFSVKSGKTIIRKYFNTQWELSIEKYKRDDNLEIGAQRTAHEIEVKQCHE